MGLLALLFIAGPILALLFAGGGPGTFGPGRVVGLVLVAVPLAVVFGTVFSLIDGFTTFFVVPVMLVEDRNVLSAWGRFWGVLKGDWKEYLVFVVLTAVLTLVAATAVGFVVGIVGLLLVGPVVVAGIASAVAGSPILLGIVAVVGLLAGLVVLFVAAVVRVPVVTYFRYYAMLVLGDTETELDPIPERRSRIRAVGSEEGPETPDDASGAESV
jgi:preprotein translocase subunit Sss1